jgi:DNA polymerase-3 subunit alpha
MSRYVDLHLHGAHSLLDGLIKPVPLMEKCKTLGRDAVALTDHGSLGGLVEFHKAANKAGIKPLLGCEFYHDRGDQVNYHLILIARNREGYRNLVRLNNLAQGNIYKKPRITDEMIRSHGSGLVLLTACVQGYLASTAIRGVPDWQWFKAAQGWVDAAYLEVQNHGISDEELVRDAFIYSGLPCVGTVDAHYLNAQDGGAHEVGLAVSMNKMAGEFKFPGSGYHVRDESEIKLPPMVLDATADVAATVEVYDLGYDTWQLPEVDLDPGHELAELEFRLNDYLVSSFGFEAVQYDPDGTILSYLERLTYEFKVIRDNGFLPYFKIVAEICRFVDEDLKSLRGWGRGSAAGSLVAMLMGITKIDPIRWGLYFERFLNPDRISPPDIDLDFKPEDRQPVLEFMRNRWGRVYQIGTYTTLGPRETILSCSRAMGVQTSLADFVPVEAPVPPISELMGREAFAKRVAVEGNEDFVAVCMSLEGLPRNPSAHASGVVIDVADEVPVRISKSGANAGIPVTAYDMYSLEDLMLTKIDVLGVNALSIIDRACRAVGVRVDDFPLGDARTFEAFNSGSTLGVFQFETHSFAKLIRDLHPDSFEELVDLNTLGRPGCLESGMTEEYMDRKFGRRERLPIHPKLADSLGHQGLPLFQEQMMLIARELAGFTMAEADILRKAIGKKQKDLFESIHVKFVEGCGTTSGVPIEEAEGVWATLEKSARYTWNLSHAVAYTLVSYWTMYLSANYPVEWFCELLNGAAAGNDSSVRRRALLSECRRRGVPVSRPNANLSGREYTVSGGTVMLGLSGIKYVGEKAVEHILAARGSGKPFMGSEDLKNRCGAKNVNSRAVTYLLKAGCFPDEYEPSRDDEMEALGYSVSGRAIDQGFLRFVEGAGEVLDVKAITSKKGDPMCFASVDFHDEIRSVVVFPRQYSEYREVLVRGAVLGFSTRAGEDILEGLFDPCNLDELIMEIPERKADEFLSFYPSCAGLPTVRAAGYDLASVPLTPQMVEFTAAEFGVEKMITRKSFQGHGR